MNRSTRRVVHVLVLFATTLFTIPLLSAPLRSGDSLVLARNGGSDLVAIPADDPVIGFVETSGTGDVVLRISLEGSSRVVVVGASERRTLRLRDAFDSKTLRSSTLRVEILSGDGEVAVTASELNLVTDLDHAARRRGVVHRPKPSSFALIDQAQQSGTISAETALVYRVYANFGDVRLPAQYRGDDSGLPDSFYMLEVRDRFSTLSAGAQQIVQPFLNPPAYKDSWANASSDVNAFTNSTPPPCQLFSDKWAKVDTANGLVRIWYQAALPVDHLRADALSTTINNTIWPKLTSLLFGHAPVSDLQEDCDGGDSRLDIYLADVGNSDTVTFKACDHTPRAAFILLKRTTTDALAVHEIFHAFEMSYPLAGCINDDNYRWWTEGSAQWSEDYVFPADNAEQTVAPDFLNVPDQSLDTNGQRHDWSTYLLAFYQFRKSGNADFMRASWEKSATQPALEALDASLPGGFAAIWPEFVKDNWNQEPFTDYKTWDGLKAGAQSASGGSPVPIVAAPERVITLKLGLPRLSATYKDFTFDDSVRTVAFWNGVTKNLTLRDSPPVGVSYAYDAADPAKTKGAHITALLRRDKQWTTEDWTDRPVVEYCRDQLADRIDELVLIISNSEYKDRARKLDAPGLPPVLFTSNVGCWQWTGTTVATQISGNTTMRIAATATWTRSMAMQPPAALLYTATGTQKWTATGGCTGSGTLDIPTELSTLETLNFIPQEGSFHRTYYGFGEQNGTGSVNVTCNNVKQKMTLPPWYQNPLPPPLSPGFPGARFLYVADDGALSDAYDSPFGDGVTSWLFSPQREP